MTKRETLQRDMNDAFRGLRASGFKEVFDIEIESKFNIRERDMVTSRVDGRKFTIQQRLWLGTFKCGYVAAMGLL